ncbi:MAG: hypothetical protein QF415_01540 [Candidatus Undinarchaeales archaeon]|jgi:hypothetical protein|nr:hypothetical protein [Candidatus Undinarchaeales archaeon]MDP7493389.1 hypothetical protein [Candidatus Undinarchaeales archaeon]
MSWERWSPTRKGLALGVLLGFAFSLTSLLATCHPQAVDGGFDECTGMPMLLFGTAEFLFFIPIGALSFLLGVELSLPVQLIAGPVLTLSIIGAAAGDLYKYLGPADIKR